MEEGEEYAIPMEEIHKIADKLSKGEKVDI
jgi:hypothetical protein